MSAIRTSVLRSMNGSTQYLVGSGTISMSLSLIAAQPRKLLASKPSPSSNTPSESSSMGKVRWCQAPIRSVNLRSKNSTFSSAANFRTFLGFMLSSGRVFIKFRYNPKTRIASPPVPSTCPHPLGSGAFGIVFCLCQKWSAQPLGYHAAGHSRRQQVVSLLAVDRQVQPCELFITRHPERAKKTYKLEYQEGSDPGRHPRGRDSHRLGK